MKCKHGLTLSKLFTIILVAILLSITLLSAFTLDIWQIKPAQAMELFSDGFETGTFGAWTGVSGVAYPNDTVLKNSGTYGANATGTGNYYCYQTIASQSPVYVCQYIRVSTLPSDGNALVFGKILNGATREVEGWVLGNDTAANWAIAFKDSGGSVQSATSTSAVSVNTWYRVELKWNKTDSAGGAALYVDGVEITNSTGYTTETANVDTVRCGLQGTSPSGTLWWDDCIIGDAYVGSPPTEGDGVASSWAYRISQNSSSCYIIDSTGANIYSNADPGVVINKAFTYADGNATKSIYVYPDNYMTGTAIGINPTYGTGYSNIYIQFGPSTNITRSSGAGEADYMFYLSNWGGATTNFTMISNGTVTFNAAGYCNGFDIEAYSTGGGIYNLTVANVTLQHLYGQGINHFRSRYATWANISLYSFDESYLGQSAMANEDVQYSTFTNITLDGNNQALTRVGFYLSDWHDGYGWNGSYFNTISELWVKNTRRDGIYLNSGAGGWHVYNNTFTNCTIENNWQSGYDAIKLRPAQNNTFTEIVIRNFTDAITTGTSMAGETNGNCTGNSITAAISNTTVTSLILTADGPDQSVDNNFFNLTLTNGKHLYASQGYNSPIHNNIVYMNFTDCTDAIYLEQGNITQNTFYLNFSRCGSGGHPDIWHWDATWANITDNTFYVYATSGNPNGLMDFTNGTQGNIVFYPYVSGEVGVVITSPTNTTYVTSSITVNFGAAGGTIDKRWYNCKNSSSWIYPSNQTYTTETNMTGFVDGTSYKLYAWANNTLGAEGEATVMFSVAISEVVVTISYPTSTTYTASNISVTFSAAGGTIDKKWFNCKNASTWIYGSNQTYTTATNMTGFVTGISYTFYAWANNTEGTQGYATVTFSVSISTPTAGSSVTFTFAKNYYLPLSNDIYLIMGKEISFECDKIIYGNGIFFGSDETLWLDSTINMNLTVFFEDDWLNYTVSTSGTQEIHKGTKPLAVYFNNVAMAEGSGWTFSAGTVTVTGATTSAALVWHEESGSTPSGTTTSSGTSLGLVYFVAVSKNKGVPGVEIFIFEGPVNESVGSWLTNDEGIAEASLAPGQYTYRASLYQKTKTGSFRYIGGDESPTITINFDIQEAGLLTRQSLTLMIAVIIIMGVIAAVVVILRPKF